MLMIDCHKNKYPHLGARGLSPPQPSPDKMTKSSFFPLIVPPAQKSFPHDNLSEDILSYIKIYNYMYPSYILRKHYMGELGYRVVKLEDGVVRVEIFNEDMMEMATLYFEHAKKGFNKKPIGMDGWVCIDAKVWGNLYGYSKLTPRQVIDECRKRIDEYRLVPSLKDNRENTIDNGSKE